MYSFPGGRSFLENHLKDPDSVVFFEVAAVTFRVLFVFVAIAPERRRQLHLPFTANPTAARSAQHSGRWASAGQATSSGERPEVFRDSRKEM